MMTKEVEAIDPALVARMANMLRGLAAVDYNDVGQYFAKNTVENARDIVADLPKPIDPDLLLARQIARDTCLTWSGSDWGHHVMRGVMDDTDRVKVALAAIKRGRELAPVSA